MKKLMLLMLLLALSKSGYAAMGACHDGNGNITLLVYENALSSYYTTTPNCVLYDTEFDGSAPQITELSTDDYLNLQNLIKATPTKYFKFANGLPTEMDATEKAAVDAAELSARRLANRALAKDIVEFGNEVDMVTLRAIVKVLYGSIVQTRSKVNEVIQNANFPTTTPTQLTNRTFAEAIAAVKTEIDNGNGEA